MDSVWVVMSRESNQSIKQFFLLENEAVYVPASVGRCWRVLSVGMLVCSALCYVFRAEGKEGVVVKGTYVHHVQGDFQCIRTPAACKALMKIPADLTLTQVIVAMDVHLFTTDTPQFYTLPMKGSIEDAYSRLHRTAFSQMGIDTLLASLAKEGISRKNVVFCAHLGSFGLCADGSSLRGDQRGLNIQSIYLGERQQQAMVVASTEIQSPSNRGVLDLSDTRGLVAIGEGKSSLVSSRDSLWEAKREEGALSEPFEKHSERSQEELRKKVGVRRFFCCF